MQRLRDYCILIYVLCIIYVCFTYFISFVRFRRILCFCINKHVLTTGLIETCSVLKNNSKYRVCQTEYIALFVFLCTPVCYGLLLQRNIPK
jgi:hypothetical protein